MKLPISSWVIIRWAVVSVLFAGTVAIAVDQVKTRDEAVIVLESAAKASKEELRKANEESWKLRIQLDDALGKLRQLADAAKNLDEAREKQIDALAAQNKALKNHAVTEETSSPQRAVAMPYAFATPAAIPGESAPASVYPSTAPAESPFWRSYAGTQILQEIKASANKQWGTNYRMVEFEVKRQKEAYEQFLNYNNSHNKVTKTIVANAVQQWGNDYRMTVYEIKRQLEAKHRIDGR